MGIDIRDKLMVGAYVSDLDEFFTNLIENGDENYDSYGDRGEVIEVYFDYMSPYYDSDPDDWFVGFHIMNGVPIKELIENVKEASEKFEKITGIIPVVKGGAHVF